MNAIRKTLTLAAGIALVATLVGCGGGGDPVGRIISPPPPTTYYGGSARALADGCDFGVGSLTTRYSSSSSARNAAVQRCESEVRRQAAGSSQSCNSGYFSTCAAIAAGQNDDSRRCQITTRYRSTLSAAQSAAVQDCDNSLGASVCRVITSACASGSAPPTGVWRHSGGPPIITPPPPPPTTFPSEPPRRLAPQGSGSDLPGIEVAGAGGTRYVSAWNRTSTTVVYSAGTWFEPKDGQYQRMIVTQSTRVSAGQVARVPTACMQQGNPAPASGARFFSRPKSASGSVQQCQQGCLSGSPSNFQSCVWRCESQTAPPPPPPPPPATGVTVRITDACNDGRDIAVEILPVQRSVFPETCRRGHLYQPVVARWKQCLGDGGIQHHRREGP